MPPLEEGTILFMPTTLPGISVARARELLRQQDGDPPFVSRGRERVGQGGTREHRDRSGRPRHGRDHHRPQTGVRVARRHDLRPLIAAMDSAVRLPGVTNAWTMPIKGRIDMLATGIRTPVGVKLYGPDLGELERLGKEVEGHLKMVPGTRSASRSGRQSGYYLDIEIDRAARRATASMSATSRR
jgi:Cu(I)/Ag(I) efflux system membrane protein CusA/SilA